MKRETDFPDVTKVEKRDMKEERSLGEYMRGRRGVLARMGLAHGILKGERERRSEGR